MAFEILKALFLACIITPLFSLIEFFKTRLPFPVRPLHAPSSSCTVQRHSTMHFSTEVKC